MTGLALLCIGFLVGWLLAEVRSLWRDEDRSRRFQQHMDEATDITRPIGPEDRSDWGAKR